MNFIGQHQIRAVSRGSNGDKPPSNDGVSTKLYKSGLKCEKCSSPLSLYDDGTMCKYHRVIVFKCCHSLLDVQVIKFYFGNFKLKRYTVVEVIATGSISIMFALLCLSRIK